MLTLLLVLDCVFLSLENFSWQVRKNHYISDISDSRNVFLFIIGGFLKFKEKYEKKYLIAR